MQMIKLKIASVQTQLKQLGFEPFPIYAELADLSKGCAGMAHVLTSRIQISNSYYNSEHKSEVIDRTVPHEVVHLYVSKYFPQHKIGHGKEFKQLMRDLGCDTSTFHNMALPEMVRRKNKVARFVYSTGAGVEANLTRPQHIKALAGTSFSLQGEKLTFTGKEIRV